MSKEFYVTEPSRDALAAVCSMYYGNQAFQNTVDENSLQDVLIQTAAKDPQLMLSVQPNIRTMRDCPNIQHLMTMLIEESTRIHLILTTREDKNQERILKKRALQRDLEALKHEINDTPDQDLIVGVLRSATRIEEKKISNPVPGSTGVGHG